MKLDRILTSGFSFDRDSYELKLKYILFNSLVLFVAGVISFAAIIRFTNQQYYQVAIDAAYVAVALIVFLLARKSAKSFGRLSAFILFFSYIIITLTFAHNINYLIGVGWYFFLILITFFFKGKEIGIMAFVVSITTIIVISVVQGSHQASEIFLGILPLFAGLIAMLFFDQKDKDDRQLVEAQKSELAYMAQHDWLTGVANRALFMDRLSQTVKLAQRLDFKVAVLFIDLDHFKEINDTYGHHAGDIVLKEVATRLQSKLRESDTLGRLGGDEYAIIINSLRDKVDLDDIIKKLLDSMKKPILADENKIKVSFSLGATVYPDDATDVEHLLKNADVAMYNAKEGKGYFVHSAQGVS